MRNASFLPKASNDVGASTSASGTTMTSGTSA